MGEEEEEEEEEGRTTTTTELGDPQCKAMQCFTTQCHEKCYSMHRVRPLIALLGIRLCQS